MNHIFKKPLYIIEFIMLLVISGCDKKSDPQPTLENSDYTGDPRIVILSNSLNISSVSGFGVVGDSYTFTVRAQSKEGILIVGTDLLDNDGNIINAVSVSSGGSDVGSSNSQTNFSNVNITDYTGSFTLIVPISVKDSIKVRAVLIDKIEHKEFAYFTIYLKKPPFKIYFTDALILGDSISFDTVHANGSGSFYLLAESNSTPNLITYDLIKKSTKKSVSGFSKKGSFSNSNNYNFFSDYFDVAFSDTGTYVLQAYSKDIYGTSDTAQIEIYSLPPVPSSNDDLTIGAQDNTILGISLYCDNSYYLQNTYRSLKNSSYPKSTLSYIYDNSTSYLISIYERKTANIYGDSLPVNDQKTIFVELDLPVASYDTISGNYIFQMNIPSNSPGKIPISTSKLIGYQDAANNKGIVRITNISTGATGSIKFDIKHQFKLGTQ